MNRSRFFPTPKAGTTSVRTTGADHAVQDDRRQEPSNRREFGRPSGDGDPLARRYRPPLRVREVCGRESDLFRAPSGWRSALRGQYRRTYPRTVCRHARLFRDRQRAGLLQAIREFSPEVEADHGRDDRRSARREILRAGHESRPRLVQIHGRGVRKIRAAFDAHRAQLSRRLLLQESRRREGRGSDRQRRRYRARADAFVGLALGVRESSSGYGGRGRGNVAAVSSGRDQQLLVRRPERRQRYVTRRRCGAPSTSTGGPLTAPTGSTFTPAIESAAEALHSPAAIPRSSRPTKGTKCAHSAMG